MKRLALCFAFSAATVFGQPPSTPDTPFTLATFEARGEVRIGLVLGETVLELRGANTSMTQSEGLSRVDIPSDMRTLIETYDQVKTRLYQIANHFAGKSVDADAFAFDLDTVSLKAPIRYPYNMLAAAANYQDHSAEMARRYGNPAPKPVDPDRVSPTFFAKSPRSCILDPGEAFPMPSVPGKAFDWENELAVIIGKPAKHLTFDNAKDHVFGYSIVFDVSTRDNGDEDEEDDEGGWSFGVNWFEAKSRDNAAPFGPVIVPKEFLPNSGELRMVTKINGVVKQDGNTKDMIHDEARLLRHVTSILTLYPGDVVLTGTPAGVGSARQPPEFLEPGDVVEMWIEGIGTLVTPIEAAP